jgi:CubicO group peptidase (beta-lactamase class C family)
MTAATPVGRTRPDELSAARAIAAGHPAVGLAIGVVRDGRLAEFGGHGLADIGSGATVTPDTVFRIASVTKVFTAVAVMQLVERGPVPHRCWHEACVSATAKPTHCSQGESSDAVRH